MATNPRLGARRPRLVRITPSLPDPAARPATAQVVVVLAVCRKVYRASEEALAALTRPANGAPELELTAEELLLAPACGWNGPADEHAAKRAAEERLVLQLTRHAWRDGYWPRSAPAITWRAALPAAEVNPAVRQIMGVERQRES